MQTKGATALLMALHLDGVVVQTLFVLVLLGPALLQVGAAHLGIAIALLPFRDL